MRFTYVMNREKAFAVIDIATNCALWITDYSSCVEYLHIHELFDSTKIVELELYCDEMD